MQRDGFGHIGELKGDLLHLKASPNERSNCADTLDVFWKIRQGVGGSLVPFANGLGVPRE